MDASTLPKDPFPSTIKKLKSVERIMSFFDILCGKSRSTDVIFLVIDVFCKFPTDKTKTIKILRPKTKSKCKNGSVVKWFSYTHLTLELNQIGALIRNWYIIKFTLFSGQQFVPTISWILLQVLK